MLADLWTLAALMLDNAAEWGAERRHQRVDRDAGHDAHRDAVRNGVTTPVEQMGRLWIEGDQR